MYQKDTQRDRKDRKGSSGPITAAASFFAPSSLCLHRSKVIEYDVGNKLSFNLFVMCRERKREREREGRKKSSITVWGVDSALEGF